MNHLYPMLLTAVAISGCGPEPSDSATPSRNPAQYWNQAYADTVYLYGTEPNEFFRAQLATLPPGRVLLPAEGEGRNAVFAARQGWQVDAFDLSARGREKALRLAKENAVTINYTLNDFARPPVQPKQYDMIALIYAHVPEAVRDAGMPVLMDSLKPGGLFVVEVFSLTREASGSSFGPQDAGLCIRAEELRKRFAGYELRILREEVVQLDEGRHAGSGMVTRMVARKE